MIRKKHRFPDSLLVLMLFGIFAACILAVLLTGAKAYKRLTERGEQAFDSRTAQRYIEMRLHQADEKGRIYLGGFDGKNGKVEDTSVLFLEESAEGRVYETRVYCFDGYICELFTEAGTEMEPEDGEKIIPAAGLSFRWEKPDFLEASLTDTEGKEFKIYYRIRSREGIL